MNSILFKSVIFPDFVRNYLSVFKNNILGFSVARKNVDFVVGNSSSGLSEVPSFKKPTINLGIRQRGRIFAKSVINIQEVNLKNLEKAFNKASSKKVKKLSESS